jgi:hypothetical protein
VILERDRANHRGVAVRSGIRTKADMPGFGYATSGILDSIERKLAMGRLG